MTDKKFYFLINNIFFSKIIIPGNNYRKKNRTKTDTGGLVLMH